MATGGNNMHNDAYISDSYAVSGPLGVDAKVISRTQGFGGYGTLAFDGAGRIVAVYSNGRGFQIELMDPDTSSRNTRLLGGRSSAGISRPFSPIRSSRFSGAQGARLSSVPTPKGASPSTGGAA